MSCSESKNRPGVVKSCFYCIRVFIFSPHRKNWCSKGDSGLLFHTLDVVVPKIRSPMLEPFREILNEYLEQVTYCLYGYPQKRPRLRHIQDHCAAQVSLTWERAIQLFDLYRPDRLPDFNSYKYVSGVWGR